MGLFVLHSGPRAIPAWLSLQGPPRTLVFAFSAVLVGHLVFADIQVRPAHTTNLAGPLAREQDHSQGTASDQMARLNLVPEDGYLGIGEIAFTCLRRIELDPLAGVQCDIRGANAAFFIDIQVRSIYSRSSREIFDNILTT